MLPAPHPPSYPTRAAGTLNRRDPLFISGLVVVLLFVLMLSVTFRALLFMRFMSMLLLVATLIFAGIIAFRVYFKGKL